MQIVFKTRTNICDLKEFLCQFKLVFTYKYIKLEKNFFSLNVFYFQFFKRPKHFSNYDIHLITIM